MIKKMSQNILIDFIKATKNQELVYSNILKIGIDHANVNFTFLLTKLASNESQSHHRDPSPRSNRQILHKNLRSLQRAYRKDY
jgi:hypothetical protein